MCSSVTASEMLSVEVIDAGLGFVEIWPAHKSGEADPMIGWPSVSQ